MRSRLGRKIWTAALLGLPAALFAHVIVFGGEHTLGGSAHSWLLEFGGVFAFLGTLVAAIGAVRRSTAVVPKFAPILTGAAGWFGIIELCESAHGIPIAAVIAALVFAAWIVRAVLSAFAHTVAAIAAILQLYLRAAKPPAPALIKRAVPRAHSCVHRLRLFSRPPPLFA